MSSGAQVEATIAHINHACGYSGLTDAWWDPERPHYLYIRCAECGAEWEQTR